MVGGLAGYGLIPHRPDDVFGIGVYHYDFSDDLRIGIAPLVEIEPETGVEVFYNLAVTPWFRLTADLQWIEPVNKNLQESWLGGMRASIAF